MPFTSRGIRSGIEKLKVQSGKQPDKRMQIGNAVARLHLEPNKAIEVTNALCALNTTKERYDKAVEMIGKNLADSIYNVL